MFAELVLIVGSAGADMADSTAKDWAGAGVRVGLLSVGWSDYQMYCAALSGMQKRPLPVLC